MLHVSASDIILDVHKSAIEEGKFHRVKDVTNLLKELGLSFGKADVNRFELEAGNIVVNPSIGITECLEVSREGIKEFGTEFNGFFVVHRK